MSEGKGKHTADSLRVFLVESCGCKHIGKDYPPPWSGDYDLPDLFLSPDGRSFSVSPPDLGQYYSDFLVEKYMQLNHLKVKSPMIIAKTKKV